MVVDSSVICADIWVSNCTTEPEPVVPVSAGDLAATAARSPLGGLVVIDTPPGTAGVIDAAIDAADLVVIPSGAAPADIDRVWPTLHLTTHRATAILLTGVDLRTALATAVPAHLRAAGAPVLHAVVRRRQAILEAFGRRPDRLWDYADVWAAAVVAPNLDPAPAAARRGRPRTHGGPMTRTTVLYPATGLTALKVAAVHARSSVGELVREAIAAGLKTPARLAATADAYLRVAGVRTTLDVDVETHRRLKVLAAEKAVTVQSLILAAIHHAHPEML